MAGKFLWKNLTGTVCALSLTFTATNNSTQLINSIDDVLETGHVWGDERGYVPINSVIHDEINNIYTQPKKDKLDAEAQFLFGQMREATAEESAGVNNYIKNVSKNTGVNFFDLC